MAKCQNLICDGMQGGSAGVGRGCACTIRATRGAVSSAVHATLQTHLRRRRKSAEDGSATRFRRLPMTIRQIAICAALVALASATIVTSGQPARALTMKECSAKYQAAKSAGTLGGQNWRDFRKTQCGADATAATTAAAPPAATPATAPKPAGSAVFPTAVSPKYSSEGPGKARPHP